MTAVVSEAERETESAGHTHMRQPKLLIHPVANIFPMMADAEIADLAADIAEHGQREPVWLYDGQIIDGRNRAAACKLIGREPNAREFLGATDELVPFVVSLNLKRRHLSESQRSMVAGAIAKLSHGGDRVSEQAANLPVATQAEAAEMLNVSERSVRAAVKVRAEAPEEVIEAVQQGLMSVSLASEVVELPPEDIEAISAAPVAERRDIAREAVKRAHVANNSGNNEWYTPAAYIERARQAMGGIDLDPASSDVANEAVRAATYYTAQDDGLTKPWHGRVWMNPPYAQPLMGQFAEAVVDKYCSREIEQACILVNNATETQWFQRMLGVAGAVCLPHGRIRFVDPEGKPSGAPLQGQAVLYLGENLQEFAHAFNSVGRVLWTVSQSELGGDDYDF